MNSNKTFQAKQEGDALKQAEAFFYEEADLLDWWQLREWLGLLHDDIRYSMPMVRNVPYDQKDKQYTDVETEMAWFDEGKHMLEQRVKQIETGVHWAEEPLSRVSHIVSNIRLLAVRGKEIDLSCRIAVYRNRMTRETDWYVGKRRDTLIKNDGRLLLLKRMIYLDHGILLPKNLTIFF